VALATSLGVPAGRARCHPERVPLIHPVRRLDVRGRELDTWQLPELDAEEAAGGRADFAERLVRRFLVLCEHPRTRRRMLAMVKSSVRGGGRHGSRGRRMYAVINRAVLHPAAKGSGMQASALRAELVASQLIGLAMMRYILQVEPVASASIDELVENVAPGVRAVLGK